ncbi:MAG: cytidylate kinase-like family protein [Muribaculaceae bacterium]|nr:cytidylate kinase-like family protein [Muribaculaceae bacterium]
MADNKNVVVTIGRSFGSGGRELGRRLAERLGAKYYDKELLSEAARAAGVGEEFFKRSDEKFPSFINGIFSFAFGYNSTNYYSGSTTISDDSIYRAQSDFIHSLAEGPESCVIVGRTADYILRDHPRCVNVFVHAPDDACVQRIVSRGDWEGCSAEKIKAKARKVNKLRANYYNFYTDKVWGDARSYDLSFDTSKISLDDIVDIIADYLSRRFG